MVHNDASTKTFSNKQEFSNKSIDQNTSTSTVVTTVAKILTNNLVTNLHFNQTILPTAMVDLHANGRTLRVRALLDQGSQVSCITEAIVQLLKLKRQSIFVELTGIGSNRTGKINSAVMCNISPYQNNTRLILITAVSLTKITNYQSEPIRFDPEWTHLTGLDLADPEMHQHHNIDLLLGADIFGDIILQGVRTGITDTPTAQLTLLGWIISGAISSSSGKDVPSDTRLSPDESICEKHFQTTHKRLESGQYEIKLPFKLSPPFPIGETKSIATKIFLKNESRLKNRPKLYSEYQEFLAEYKSLNHMSLDNDESDDKQRVYIPHLPVVRESSQTTKLRVVFNASCRSSNGSTLNDYLHVGQKLQSDLFALILQWRLHRYVYLADITKMFRQIRVSDNDCNYQQIIWRKHPDEELKTYRLKTVTYGTACAPFIANRILKQIAVDEGKNYPLAAPVLENNFFTRNQLINLLKSGNMELRKWANNSKDLLHDIPEANHGLAIRITSESPTIQLHGFSDASSIAYAAVIYIKVISKDENKISLLYTKTKVAPLTPLSIPRMELCAAVLLCKAMNYVKASLKLYKVEIFCWTDASVILHWLNDHPSRWKLFVANRVLYIQLNLSEAKWQHVPGEENPADCASRGITVEKLKLHNLWWQGPMWLQHNENQWPEQTQVPHLFNNSESEEKASVVTSFKRQSNVLVGAYRYFILLD
ncbi:uncharacterized protein LOC114929791 [Nylanderia fulva]|uniref:uncharacterized protein LOC114929791 n=1 Tax=Nylanderia fulva TaxID=613905 RepID=UPI0010FB3ED1|nr:uncharacterized protein LOC114929791 [Nylanderia fulva]